MTQHLPGQPHQLPRHRMPLANYQGQHILYQCQDGVATISLNRPERKNPLSFDSYAELRDLFRQMVYADDVHAIVITGQGGNFCSGGDVHEIIGPLTQLDMPGLLTFTRMTGDVIKAMRACPQPIVAAIDGICAGAGALLALGSDLRYGTERSKTYFLFNKVGLAGCDMGACALLPRVIGQGRASELLYTGRGLGGAQAEAWGLPGDRIVLSCKVSAVQDLIRVYRDLAARCDYPLHLGLTEAGMGSKGIVASSAAMAVLLQEGIGDTIRVSLTPEPGGDRTREVIVAQELLQTMGLRSFAPMVIACPGCGRTTSTVFQVLAERIQTYLRQQMPSWRLIYPGVEDMHVAVMGCVVNGPGESKQADIGISLPGSGETPVAPVYVDGEKTVTLKGDHIAEEFQAIVEDYVQRRFAVDATAGGEAQAKPAPKKPASRIIPIQS